MLMNSSAPQETWHPSKCQSRWSTRTWRCASVGTPFFEVSLAVLFGPDAIGASSFPGLGSWYPPMTDRYSARIIEQDTSCDSAIGLIFSQSAEQREEDEVGESLACLCIRKLKHLGSPSVILQLAASSAAPFSSAFFACHTNSHCDAQRWPSLVASRAAGALPRDTMDSSEDNGKMALEKNKESRKFETMAIAVRSLFMTEGAQSSVAE